MLTITHHTRWETILKNSKGKFKKLYYFTYADLFEVLETII